LEIPVLKKTIRVTRQYWRFTSSVIVSIIGLGFQLLGSHTVVHWLLGTAALFLTIPLITSMWEDVRSGKYGIDVLAATAVITSVLLHQYWAAIVIVIMLTSGEALEEFAERRAHGELRALLERAPQQAHVVRGRKNFDIAAAEVHEGEKIVIKVGEVVPVDAIILEGAGSFDEASLTGESLPVTKGVGEQILSGTINLDGVITARAIHTAADSQYEQIIALVQGAANNQAPFVRLADRYSIPFTITAYVIAISAWVLGHHAIRFLEVIVVATPCPLLIAAPIALISGMSRASKYGIIIKTGSALEKLAEAETFAFDKTGTLTQGQLHVNSVTAFKPYSKNEILGLAASLEQGSVHVLAQAIVTAATEKHFSFTKAKHVKEFSGSGMKATLHGKEVLVGRLGLLDAHGVNLPKDIQPKETASYVAVDGVLAGVITFTDELRPETKQMLTRLKQLGVKQLLMVTGDTESAAQTVAKKLGIDAVYAEASPATKLHTIEGLVDRPVAFVGDGVNDAPVLTASDIGIALGARGSTAASESADIVIMQDNIGHIALSLGIARRSFSIARQSILVGILLSLILMVVFATGKFPPLLGAVLQEVVDVVVIFNALRAHLTPKAEKSEF
jgi:heavy metal translocating P-type ATPase